MFVHRPAATRRHTLLLLSVRGSPSSHHSQLCSSAAAASEATPAAECDEAGGGGKADQQTRDERTTTNGGEQCSSSHQTLSKAVEPSSATDARDVLARENAFPTHFAKSRGSGDPVFALVPGRKGELLADYVLWEHAVTKSQKVPWPCFDKMTSEERRILNAHQKAVRDGKMFYKCPETAQLVPTVAQLLYDGQCCGAGCRHCPYALEGCDGHRKRALCWNGVFYV